MGGSEPTYYQKGFNLKAVVRPVLAASYHSALVDRLKELGYTARVGEVRVKLAREFGFCYGVDRAVEYAYEARERFPDRRIFLSGEIIHNPEVNGRIEGLGIRILPDRPSPEERYSGVDAADVVILPAFGVSVGEMKTLREKGCVLVDTTCGSVLNVWKNVQRYAREGFTAVIHGKHYHEETKATASQAVAFSGGRYLCVRDRVEAELVCGFIRGELPGLALLERFRGSASAGFDPEHDLQRIGLANQTTMLMAESLQIERMLRAAMLARWGEAELESRFRSFDTICSATQDRQDAVRALLEEGGLTLMVVIGGYNSSNTQALARLCAERLPTYHISGADRIEGATIHHRPVGSQEEMPTTCWLPAGPVTVGLTAGASTPNNVVGEVIERILTARGLKAADLVAD